jgi:hypothetical protein
MFLGLRRRPYILSRDLAWNPISTCADDNPHFEVGPRIFVCTVQLRAESSPSLIVRYRSEYGSTDNYTVTRNIGDAQKDIWPLRAIFTYSFVSCMESGEILPL